MKHKLTSLAAIYSVLFLIAGCGNTAKEKTVLYPLLVVTSSDALAEKSDKSLPKEILDILTPLNLDTCTQKDIPKFWKANAKLSTIDVPERGYIQISPDYETDLVPAQDSLNYMQAIQGFKLNDGLLLKRNNLDSDYIARNLSVILKENHGALKVLYNSDPPLHDKQDSFSTFRDMNELRATIAKYLCSANPNKQIVIYYRVSLPGAIKQDSAYTVVKVVPKVHPDSVAVTPVPPIRKKPGKKNPYLLIPENNRSKEIDPTKSTSNKITVKRKDVKSN